jgi:hypothetical protein
VQAECPGCLACLRTFQGRIQPWGALWSSRPAWRILSLHRAREMGERALTGPKKCALAGNHVARSAARPPPGTI